MQSKSETPVSLEPESLVAVIPQMSSRWDAKEIRCKPAPWVVRPGISQSQPRYLPPSWNTYVQPEGQLYFASDATPRTVTDRDFYDPAIQEKIIRFAKLACKLAEERNIALPETSELYLEPVPETDCCYYYFVDHATQSVFWLEERDNDYLGFDEVVSDTQSAYVLERQYWFHVEFFPSHRAHLLSLKLDELIPVFLQGECDQRTSQSSTFPYAAKECKEFLRLLQYARENPYSAFNVCLMARLWGAIAYHRHLTFYGHPIARLDRVQSVIDGPEQKRGLVFAAASHLLVGVPGWYGDRLDKCWVDKVAVSHVWRDFLASTREDWKQSMIMSFGLSFFNALLLLVPGTSEPLAIASLLCCAVVTVSSLMLHSRPVHHKTAAEDASAFLWSSGEDSNATTALAFALPRAFFYWATGLTVAQAFVWLARTISEHVPLEREVTMCAFAALALGVFLAVCVPWRRLGAVVSGAVRIPRWRRKRSDDDSQSESAPEICEKV